MSDQSTVSAPEPTIAPAPSRVAMVCASCGSTDVMRDAWAVWNTETQEWELGNVFDDARCENCDREVRIDEEPLPPDTASPALPVKPARFTVHISHKQGIDLYAAKTAEGALGIVAGFAREWWEHEQVPGSPKNLSDADVVKQYFDHQETTRGEECYEIQEGELAE
ncbi:MAG: hypothetical protein PHZ23_15165 [Acidiphilium sp.]|nr:hypothetical protein [Acidiphilium sp.]